MKIYVVKCEFEDWDTHNTWLVSGHTDRTTAEAKATAYNENPLLDGANVDFVYGERYLYSVEEVSVDKSDK